MLLVCVIYSSLLFSLAWFGKRYLNQCLIEGESVRQVCATTEFQTDGARNSLESISKLKIRYKRRQNDLLVL